MTRITHKERVFRRFTYDRAYSAEDFPEIGSRSMVNTALANLAIERRIVRVRPGVYCKRGSRFDPSYRPRGVPESANTPLKDPFEG
jgi:hypothetical protein